MQVFASFDTPLKLARAVEVYEEAARMREAVAAGGKLARAAIGGLRVLSVEELEDAIVGVEGRLAQLVGDEDEGAWPRPTRSVTALPLQAAGASGVSEALSEADAEAGLMESQSVVSLVK